MSEVTGPSTPLGALTSGLLLGATTGLRSQMGVAAVVLTVDPDHLPWLLRGRRARRSALWGTVGEVVADKLPFTPSRLQSPALATRAVMAAVAAGVLAASRRQPASVVMASAAAATGAAFASARIGHDVRAALAKRYPDPAIAVGEDLVAAGLAFGAVGPERRARRRATGL
ncbi:MAG TPA: hypothetical protein VKG43_08110 [Acidimicrobiales bacterium]|nr:hypothetical protein [Acidimicrobiales bacterium]